MKKIRNRVLSLMLVLCVLCAFLVPLSAAADTDEEKLQAVIATALAYHNKGFLYQYGAKEFTVQSRVAGGVCRLTTMRHPEYAAPDDLGYTVCSDFTFCAYYHALGYELLGTPRKAITGNQSDWPANDPLTIVKYGGDDGMTDRAAAAKKGRELIRPGDIVTGTDMGGAGHAMLFIGDYKGDGEEYLIHSTGRSYDPESGYDNIEINGSVVVQNAKDVFFNEKEGGSGYSLKNGKGLAKRWTILRPMNDPAMKNFQITDAARIRMQYRDLVVTRTVDPTQYASVVTGDTIAVTTELRNKSKEDYKGIAVADPLPTGCSIDPASISNGGKLDAKGVTWSVDVPAGETLKLTYRVKVTAKRLQTVYFPMNSLNGKMPIRDITMKVDGAAFNQNNLHKLTLVSKMDGKFSAEEWAGLNQGTFLNYFFKKFTGAELDLPDTVGEIQRALFAFVPATHMPNTTDGKLWHPKAADKIPDGYRPVYDMIIREHTIGQMMCTEEDPMTPPHGINVHNRVRTFQEENYKAGDIFLGYSKPDLARCTDIKNTFSFIYLGRGKVAAWHPEKGVVIDKFDETIQRCHKDSFCVALRPTQAFDDVNNAKATAKLGFTDVPAGAWYESYLKSLTRVGVISGMTATTFAPNGNLTYGQALKLIAKGLGYDDQAAVNGGHWASGYLKLAKEEQWLKEDVDLNANISRLAFCQIATKSKGLARKSPADTFTDCNDTHVLRLHKAGVINGMTEKTFAPNAPLTRAQITKIIYLLNQV